MKKTRRLMTTAAMLAAAAMMLSTVAFATTGEATVNSYMLNMREGQGTEYTIIDVAYQGNTVNVVEDDGSGWVKVEFHGLTGYMNSMFLTYTGVGVNETYTVPEVTTVVDAAEAPAAPAPETAAAEAPAAPAGAVNGSIMGDGVYMRSGPSLNSGVLMTLNTGTPVQVNGVCGEWYEVAYGGLVGYVFGSYVVMNGSTVSYTVTTATVEADAEIYPEPADPQINADPSQTEPVAENTQPEAAEPEAAEPETAQPETQSAGPVGSGGQGIVDTAMQYIGVPYVWGGTSPTTGFDCSGLVYYVYGQHGVKLNRVAQSMLYNGSAVDTNDLQPGDILLFGSSEYNIWHAGIYVGDGNFIHAAGSGTTVRTQSLSSNYGMRLVAARRVL